MKMSLISLIVLFFIASSPLRTSAASDLEKEHRWSEQIVDSLLTGEAETLKAGDQEFLAIYTEASQGPGNRAILLLHGMGVHPNWPEVIEPLRVEMPELGWATLSLQMPILANEAREEDYLAILDEATPRIQAGIGFLQQQGMETIVLVGHSLGAAMGNQFLVQPGSDRIQALVAISTPTSTLDTRLNAADQFEKLQLPVLDLYGSRDEEVAANAAKRQQAARKSKGIRYRQMALEGADHFFTGMQDELIRTLRGWLHTTFDKPGDPQS